MAQAVGVKNIHSYDLVGEFDLYLRASFQVNQSHGAGIAGVLSPITAEILLPIALHTLYCKNRKSSTMQHISHEQHILDIVVAV